MEIDNKRIGSRIRDIRLSKGWTLEELGEKLNTSKVTVFNWEKGRNKPNKENLKKISELGGITVDELLYGTKEEIAMNAIKAGLIDFLNDWNEFKNDYTENKERYDQFLTDYYNEFMELKNPYAFQVEDPIEFIRIRVKSHLEKEFLRSDRTNEGMADYFESLIAQVQSDIYEYQHDSLTQEAIKNNKIDDSMIYELIDKLDDILNYIDDIKN